MTQKANESLMRLSLCHLPGITPAAERMLWSRGVLTWRDCLTRPLPLSPRRVAHLAQAVDASERALAERDIAYFLERLPLPERPRLWLLFAPGVLYLDIETTGLSPEAPVTTLALYDGAASRVYVRGQDLVQAAAPLQSATALVTWNGTRFDLPRLRREFGLPLRQPHLDLCPALKARGFRGGLKRVEQALGLARRDAVDVNGADAVALWRRHLLGDAQALQQLVRYNLQDALVLERITVAVCNESLSRQPLYRLQTPPRHSQIARDNVRPP